MRTLNRVTMLIVSMCLLFTPALTKAQVISVTTGAGQPQTIDSLILALEKDYPPFLFVENGEPRGIAWEYTKLLAEKIGVPLETTAPLQLQAMLDAVKNNEANLLADITKTAERDVYLEFSKPFVNTPAVVIGRKEDGKKWDNGPVPEIFVAVGKGYGVVSFLKEKYPDIQLIELSSDSEVIKSVALGAADVGVLDLGSLSYDLQKVPLSNIEVVAETGFVYSLSFAVSEKNRDFITQINQAIDQITQAERAKIFSNWLATVPQQKSVISENVLIVGGVATGIFLLIGLWVVILRRTLHKKTKQLRELNSELDQKVNQKTNEYLVLKNEADERSGELEKTKKALLNVLEDVEAEKNKLSGITDRLNIATESGQIGVWEWDFVNEKVTWNETMYALFGVKYDPSVNILELWRKSIHPDDAERRAKSLADVLAEKNKNYDVAFRIIWPNGAVRYIRGKGVVNRDATGKPIKIVGVDWDVTKEKEVDEAKSEFVSLASHQLRTPLTAIRLFVDMLAKNSAQTLTVEEKGYVQNIQMATMRMIQLVNDLLNISRLETGRLAVKPTLNNLVKILENAETVVQGLTTEFGCTLQNTAKKMKLPDIILDVSLVNEVLVSLVSNAIRYSPKNKGKVQLAIEVTPTDYIVSVKDNGIGIPVSAQVNIFRKFFRADNAVQKEADGSGLGLYIAKMIVETWSGKLWFETSEKKGTTFYFTIPVNGMIEKEGEKGIAK